MKAEPKADAAPAPRTSPKKLIVLGAAALLVLASAAATVWYFMPAGGTPAGKAEVVAAEPPVYVPLEKFIVNLQPEDGEQYLQIQFTLQVPNSDQVEAIKANMPKVQNRVLLLLSAKRPSELTTPEGKRQLSRELIAAMNEPFVDKGAPQQVSDVLYTSFIIQ